MIVAVRVWILPLALALGFPGCTPIAHKSSAGSVNAQLRLIAPGFEASMIPVENTCDGSNRSPALSWHGAPAGTKAWALSLRDPDAPGGTFTHWLLYSIPASARRLPGGLPRGPRAGKFGMQGRNGFGKLGYGGPCPPPGPAHRYLLTLRALDQALPLRPGMNFDQLHACWQGHVLARATLTSHYGRQ